MGRLVIIISRDLEVARRDRGVATIGAAGAVHRGPELLGALIIYAFTTPTAL